MVIALYSRALKRYPILTQCVATGFLMGTGDVLAQQVVERRELKHHKWARTLRLASFGWFVAGPAVVHWYLFLDKIVTLKNPFAALTARVALDQFAFTPVSLATFFTVNGLLEGISKEEIADKLNASYLTALTNNWKLWIGVQYLNFSLVPIQHRLLVVNTVSLGWNTYLSTLNAKSTATAVEDVGHWHTIDELAHEIQAEEKGHEKQLERIERQYPLKPHSIAKADL